MGKNNIMTPGSLENLVYPYLLVFGGGEVRIEQQRTEKGSIQYHYIALQLRTEAEFLTFSSSVYSLHKLIPFIEAELENNPDKYPGITTAAVLLNTNIDKEGVLFSIEEKTPQAEALAAAFKAYAKIKRAQNARQAQQAQAKETETGKVIHYKEREKTFSMPTTALVNELFKPAPDFKDIDGRIRLLPRYSPANAEKPVFLPTRCKLNDAYLKEVNGFTEEQLDDWWHENYAYNMLIVCVLDQLYREGNFDVSLEQILKRLGVPYSQKQADELERFLWIGRSYEIKVNPAALFEYYKIDKAKAGNCSGRLFEVNFDNYPVKVDGWIARKTVHIGDYSPMYKISTAFPEAQLMIWDSRLLLAYTGKVRNKRFWRISFRLMQRIGMMWSNRNTVKSDVINFDNLIEATGEKNTDKVRRAVRDMAQRILKDCFVGCGYVKKFTTDPKTWSFTIILNTHEEQAAISKRLDAKEKEAKGQQKKLQAKRKYSKSK